MKITYDPNKREKTLIERGLDFESAATLFAGRVFEIEDTRQDYGERRILCFGELNGRLLVVGYVQRGDNRHVFSMRKANDREISRYANRLVQSGRPFHPAGRVPGAAGVDR
ncbi:MAG: BrnT family toxin [Magnetococcales bacterium]|nr:BrnT family toxin [Magnetococcales bacterium]